MYSYAEKWLLTFRAMFYTFLDLDFWIKKLKSAAVKYEKRKFIASNPLLWFERCFFRFSLLCALYFSLHNYHFLYIWRKIEIPLDYSWRSTGFPVPVLSGFHLIFPVGPTFPVSPTAERIRGQVKSSCMVNMRKVLALSSVQTHDLAHFPPCVLSVARTE